jgi:succinate dehydrogenase/fumarate reductase cytochrome b subunit
LLSFSHQLKLYYICLYLQGFFLCFHLVVSNLDLKFVFNFFCYRMRDGSLVSVFYTCIYSFLQHHLLKRISFLQHDLGICVENQKGTAMCIYFWIIYCIPLISMSVFMSCSFC